MDKVALVTGALGLVGRDLIKGFKQKKYKIVAIDYDKKNIENLPPDSSHFKYLDVDLNEKNASDFIIKKTIDKFGKIDVIVNNARPKLKIFKFPESMSEWDLSQDIILKASASLIASAYNHIIKSKGTVINISSTNGFNVSQQSLGYHVAKAGLDHLTRVLAHEMGKFGVRVNGISPGLIENISKKVDQNNNFLIEETIPLKRPALLTEIVDIVLFLASKSAKYINGQTIIVDGGMSLSCPFYNSIRIDKWRCIS